MRKIVKLIVIILSLNLFTIPLYAQGIDYRKNYLLSIPELKELGRDYETEIRSYKVRLSKIDETRFKIIPLDHLKEDWFQAVKGPKEMGWIGEKGPNDDVRISGIWAMGISHVIMELSGEFLGEESIKGEATMRAGIAGQKEYPLIYKSEWVLEPEDIKKPFKISNKVTYHGVPDKPRKVKIYTPEEQAKFPPAGDGYFRTLAGYEPYFRKSVINNTSEGFKNLCNRILTELTWEEIKYTPGILLLIDHLATLAEADQRPIAKGYIDDKSWDFFGEISYSELQRTPPLFLILKCLDKMKETDIEGLKKESLRFKKMYDAYNTLQKEELSTLTLEEFILKVSGNLPEDFRKDYYHHSPKLQNYVASSDDANLKKLYPFRK